MKHKFSSMGRVAIALVLALSLSLVMAVPVSADVGEATVTPNPTTAGTAAEYTVAFTTTVDLTEGTSDNISIDFPAGTDIADYDGTVTVNGTEAASYVVDGQVLEITVPNTGGNITSPVTVVLDDDGDNDIINPPADDYTLNVWTNEEPTPVASGTYTIRGLATYFKVTGPATMTAGTPDELTVTAYDSEDNVATAYEGAQILFFSGPGVAPDGTAPKVNDETMEDEVTVSFTLGVSVAFSATLTAYNAEVTTVDVSDGAIDSTGDAAYDLDLTVEPDTEDELAYTVNPASVTAGVETSVFTVQRQDAYANPTTSGALVVNLTSTSSEADEEFRATSGGDPVTSVTIAVTASTVNFYYYDELAGTWTITASGGLSTNAVGTLIVDPAAIDNYTVVSTIASPQETNAAFPVTIQAWDEFDNDITSGGDAAEDIIVTYNKTDAGATPSSFTTEEGTATEDVTLTATTLGQSITFTGATSSKTVTSNPFQVIAGKATAVWVDDDAAAGWYDATHFTTIQAGVNAVAEDGTVNVLPGTYIPGADITIDAAGLILKSTDGAEVTIIDASNLTFTGEGGAIDINQSDVTVDGFTVRDTVGFGMAIAPGTSRVTIQNNVITDSTRIAINISGSGHLVDTNIIEDSFGIYLNAGTSGHTIENNTITGSTKIGEGAITFAPAGGIDDNIITGNTITNGAGAGIYFWSDFSGTGNEINYNNIYGNIDGIDNDSSTPVDAENNWWGDATGPSDQGPGTGDAVSANVDYTPWLTSEYTEPADPVTTATISLDAGYNLVSLSLIPEVPAINTMTVSLTELVRIYRYDALAQTPDWLIYNPLAQWPGGSTLLTMDDGWGYWVKMEDPGAGGSFTFSGSELVAEPEELPPSYDVVEGWNLIGFKSTTTSDVATYLGGVNDNLDAIYAYQDGAFFIPTELEAGLGYWIAVTDPGTIYP